MNNTQFTALTADEMTNIDGGANIKTAIKVVNTAIAVGYAIYKVVKSMPMPGPIVYH